MNPFIFLCPRFRHLWIASGAPDRPPSELLGMGGLIKRRICPRCAAPWWSAALPGDAVQDKWDDFTGLGDIRRRVRLSA